MIITATMATTQNDKLPTLCQACDLEQWCPGSTGNEAGVAQECSRYQRRIPRSLRIGYVLHIFSFWSFFASDVLESDDVEGSNDSSDICIHRSPQDMANFAAVLGVRGGLQCVSEVWPTCAV